MSLTDANIKGWPGETISVSIEPKDELGNPAGTLALLEFNSFVIDVTMESEMIPLVMFPI